MKIEVKAVQRGEHSWDAERRANALVSVDLQEEEPWPTEPCTDESCESHICKLAHEYDALMAVPGATRERVLTKLGLGHMIEAESTVNDGLEKVPWRPRPEEDHKLWKQWRARGIAKMRAVAVEAMDQGLLPQLTLSFSDKAGCSCGCSPGFRTKGGPAESRGHWYFVKEVAS